MNFLYPANNSLSIMLIALLITGSTQAQDRLIVSNTPSGVAPNNYINRVDAVVRITARSEKKVMLRWAPFQGGVSHYVLERSFDGRRYDEAGVFFTGEWSEEPEYVYTDHLRKEYTGPVLYRLKVVGLDGTEVYTLPAISQTQR